MVVEKYCMVEGRLFRIGPPAIVSVESESFQEVPPSPSVTSILPEDM
jgi:hypothetical protein